MPASRGTSSKGAAPETSGTTVTPDELAAANAEIERLRAQLATQNTPASGAMSPNRLTDVLEALAQRLTRSESPTTNNRKTTKIPDPPVLTDGSDPAFESWKIQITGKLSVNADHFVDESARIAYVFSRTGGNAQKHLQPRISSSSVDPFMTADEMIEHLASIYEDPFKVQNARRDYRRLTMKATETFPDFYTRFLHLAGEGRIPEDDLRPDLYDKLTLDLQRAIAPTEASLVTLHDFQKALRRLDQNLRQIHDRADRMKARGSSPSTKAPVKGPTSSTIPSAGPNTSAALSTKPSIRESTPDRIRPSYPDPAIQALSDKGACFSCGVKGHFSQNCPTKGKDKDETVTVHEVDQESYQESGKE
jgi:zinc knuckle protein